MLRIGPLRMSCMGAETGSVRGCSLSPLLRWASRVVPRWDAPPRSCRGVQEWASLGRGCVTESRPDRRLDSVEVVGALHLAVIAVLGLTSTTLGLTIALLDYLAKVGVLATGGLKVEDEVLDAET